MKSMISVSILILTLFFIFGCGPSQEDAYKEAERQNTITAYEEFIKNYPESKFKGKAENAIEAIKENLNKELLKAVDETNVQKVKKLIEKGADPSSYPISESDINVMWMAIVRGESGNEEAFEIIKILIDSGADPNKKTYKDDKYDGTIMEELIESYENNLKCFYRDPREQGCKRGAAHNKKILLLFDSSIQLIESWPNPGDCLEAKFIGGGWLNKGDKTIL